jgi:two-component system alkaline phosphatase synthesis response regulator PhoP
MNKILIIEDDEQVRDSVSLSLESVGYEVMEAATCQEGLQSHKKFGASVIISDVVSLESEGGKILRSLCQQSPDIPLITLTGTISDADSPKSDIQPTGPMSPHTLQKPFTLDELLATVQSALIR